MQGKFVIAIDGPAAAGKGALARLLTSHYGFAYLDTGLTYRAAAHMLLRQGTSLEDKEKAVKAAKTVRLGSLDRTVLSTQEIAQAASVIATIPEVRNVLGGKQKAFARKSGRAVLEGRDIGTVICPQADIKLYITASPQVRALRRFRDIKSRNQHATLAEVLENICYRDKRDSQRKYAPLQKASDAYLLDTTEMSIETVFQMAKAIIDPALAEREKTEG